VQRVHLYDEQDWCDAHTLFFSTLMETEERLRRGPATAMLLVVLVLVPLTGLTASPYSSTSTPPSHAV
jgi:hypothetical protein